MKCWRPCRTVPIFRPVLRSSACRQSQDLPRVRRRCGPAVVVLAHVDDFLHELRIAHGQSILIEPRVVLETRPAVAAGFQAPPIHLPLVAPDAGCNPGRAGQHVGDFRPQEVEDRTPRGHRIGNAQHELDVRGLLSKPFFTRLAAL